MTWLFIAFVAGMAWVIRWLWVRNYPARPRYVVGIDPARQDSEGATALLDRKTGRLTINPPTIPSSAQLVREWNERHGS